MKIRIALLFGLMLFQSLASASPDSIWSNCFDVTGRPVLLQDAPGSMRFEATYHDFEPTIIWDPEVASDISEEAQSFLYTHACAHHTLGHTFAAVPEDGEQRADCWAANTLISVGIFYREDLTLIQKELNEAPESVRNVAGLTRKIDLDACFKDKPKAQAHPPISEFEPLCSIELVEEEYEEVETATVEDRVPCEHCTCLRWGQCLCSHSYDTITRTEETIVIRRRFVPKEVCSPRTLLEGAVD